MTVAPYWLGLASPYYAVVAGVLGIVFIAHAVGVFIDDSEARAKRMFGFSILYLFALFALMVADKALGIGSWT